MARQTKLVSLGTLAQNTKFTFTQGKLKGISGVVYKQHESGTEVVFLGYSREIRTLPKTQRVQIDNSAKFIFAEQLKVGDQIIYNDSRETISEVSYKDCDVIVCFESISRLIWDKKRVFEQPKHIDFQFTVLVGNSRDRAGTYEFSMSDITTMTDQEKIALFDEIFHNASEKLLNMDD